MIEKLKSNEDKVFKTETGEYLTIPELGVPKPISEKINELVDAVNSIVSVQEKLIDSRFVVETKHEEPADPYAEQRKWIGKLCRFCSDGYADNIGILYTIHDSSELPFENYLRERYQHCEPVSPDDDIIYKKD